MTTAPAQPPQQRERRDRLLRIDELAAMLNVSTRQAYRLNGQGHFKALRVGASIRVTEKSVLDYIERMITRYAADNGFCDERDHE